MNGSTRMRWSSIKIAFFLCRYYPLLSFPLVIWAFVGDHDPRDCAPLIFPIHTLFIPFQICPQGVMMIRAYAFTRKKPMVLLILSSSFAALVAVTIWVYCIHPPVVLPLEWYQNSGLSGCYPNYDSSVMGLRVGMIELSAILMDSLSLSIVLLHCRRELITRSSLARFFLGQGLWAFAAILIVNVTALIIFYVPNWSFNRFGLPFLAIVSNIIACRVILELRRKAPKLRDSHSEASLTTVDTSPQTSHTYGSWLMASDWLEMTGHFKLFIMLLMNNRK